MKTLNKIFIVAFIAINALGSYAFLPHQQTSTVHSKFSGRTQQPAGLAIERLNIPNDCEMRLLVPHRRSVASVQMMGLFGLGAGELALILAAAGFIIGPQQLGNMAGQLKGDLPDDLKRIPEEFQKGFEESTENSRARNAKQMEAPPDDEGERK